MEQFLRDALKETVDVIDRIDVLRQLFGINLSEARENQVQLVGTANKCIDICESSRPNVTARYFAACCAMLNDDILDDDSKTKMVVVALILYSSLSRKYPDVAFKELKKEFDSIGINLPKQIEASVSEAIYKEKGRIPSIFEIL